MTFLQPTAADKPVKFPRVLVIRILIVVVEKKKPNKPIRITVEVDACFEEGEMFSYIDNFSNPSHDLLALNIENDVYFIHVKELFIYSNIQEFLVRYSYFFFSHGHWDMHFIFNSQES